MRSLAGSSSVRSVQPLPAPLIALANLFHHLFSRGECHVTITLLLELRIKLKEFLIKEGNEEAKVGSDRSICRRYPSLFCSSSPRPPKIKIQQRRCGPSLQRCWMLEVAFILIILFGPFSDRSISNTSRTYIRSMSCLKLLFPRKLSPNSRPF